MLKGSLHFFLENHKLVDESRDGPDSTTYWISDRIPGILYVSDSDIENRKKQKKNADKLKKKKIEKNRKKHRKNIKSFNFRYSNQVI